MDPTLRRLQLIIKSQPSISTRLFGSAAGLSVPEKPKEKKREKWLSLPPYDPTVLGKAFFSKTDETTALKWVLRSCPDLPRSLVHKLFRLRLVRREQSHLADKASGLRLKRVGAKESMSIGDRIFLPVSVRESTPQERGCSYNEEELNFIRGLVFYKDPAIIAVNKPPGLPVQGGTGVKRSLDEIASACLRYDYPESPRLMACVC